MTRSYKRSDILGAAELVAEELDAAKSVAVRKVVLFSDFIQDDAQYDFKRDAKFQSEPSAGAFEGRQMPNKSVKWIVLKASLSARGDHD